MSSDDVQNTYEPMSNGEIIVYPGPDDILIYNTNDELYKQSVTLTARMFEQKTSTGPTINILGLSPIWALLIGIIVILITVSSTILVCCCILPRKRKFLSPAKLCLRSQVSGSDSIMAHRSSLGSKGGHMIIPIGLGPPTYAPPPQIIKGRITNGVPHETKPTDKNIQQYQQQIYMQRKQLQSKQEYSVSPSHYDAGYDRQIQESQYNLPDTHKSMWAINPLCGSNSVLFENDSAYKSRSLPSYRNKQRPLSNGDDIEELYAKVNLSKKRRNRMRNGEAAIIALCRSRSQNLQGLALEREGVVIFDERTAL